MGLTAPDWASAAYGQSAIGLSAGAGELLGLLERDIAKREAELKQIWEKEEADRAEIKRAWAELQAQVEGYLEQGELEPCKRMLEQAKSMVAQAKLCLANANDIYLEDVQEEYRAGLDRRGSNAPPLVDADIPVEQSEEQEVSMKVPTTVADRPSARFLHCLRPVDSAIQLLHLVLTDRLVEPLASNVKKTIRAFRDSMSKTTTLVSAQRVQLEEITTAVQENNTALGKVLEAIAPEGEGKPEKAPQDASITSYLIQAESARKLLWDRQETSADSEERLPLSLICALDYSKRDSGVDSRPTELKVPVLVRSCLSDTWEQATLNDILNTLCSIWSCWSILDNRKVFFRTYRSVISAADLFKQFLSRFCCITLPEPTKTAQIEQDVLIRNIRARVLGMLKYWIESYGVLDFWDADGVPTEINTLVQSFLKNCVEKMGHSAIARRLLVELRKQQKPSIQRQIWRSATQRRKNVGNVTLASFSPLLFAAGLTQYEFAMYCRIEDTEFINQHWMKPHLGRAPNVLAVSKHFNKVGAWIVTQLVREPRLQVRANLLRNCVLAALHLLRMNNFNGLFELVAALCNSAITRMKSSWAAAGDEYYVVFKTLTLLFDSNYAIYKLDLGDVEPPICPFVGPFLSFITFLEDGNSDRLGDATLNFAHKFSKISEVIDTVLQFQSTPFKTGQDVSTVLEDIEAIDWGEYPEDGALYLMSKDIEPSCDVDLPEVENGTKEENLARLQALRQHIFVAADPRKGVAASTRKDSLLNEMNSFFTAKTGGKKKVRQQLLLAEEHAMSGPVDYGALARRMHKEMQKHRMKVGSTRVSSVTGEDIVSWLILHGVAESISNATFLGQELRRHRFITGVTASEFRPTADALYSFSLRGDSLFHLQAPSSVTGTELSNISDLSASDSDGETDDLSSSGFKTSHVDSPRKLVRKNSTSGNLRSLAARMRHPQSGVRIKNRKWLMKKYPMCFVGTEAVAWLVNNEPDVTDRRQAELLGKRLVRAKVIEHVCGEHDFKDAKLFYRFIDP